MVCHVALKNTTDLMKLVVASYDNNIPIKWLRVNRVPDYTKFSHSRHIRAMIDCSSCHGSVETMDSIYQAKAITMSWCLNCHRQPELYITPARDISGIFVYGVSGSSIQDLLAKQVSSQVDPPYGSWDTELPKTDTEGIILPKKIGRGSETCTSCHY
jgi:hypothetical protein